MAYQKTTEYTAMTRGAKGGTEAVVVEGVSQKDALISLARAGYHEVIWTLPDGEMLPTGSAAGLILEDVRRLDHNECLAKPGEEIRLTHVGQAIWGRHSDAHATALLTERSKDGTWLAKFADMDRPVSVGSGYTWELVNFPLPALVVARAPADEDDEEDAPTASCICAP